MLELVRLYHEHGLTLTAGSDLPNQFVVPGLSLHQELELLAQTGLPALTVLRMATRNGAEALGALDRIGTAEVGKLADLVVLSADPLADIRNTRRIEAVVRHGRLFRPWDLMA